MQRILACVCKIALALALFAGASAVRAQSTPQVAVVMPAGAGPPAVSVRNVLAERAFDDLLRNGFPARLHVRAELWTIGRWFDEIEGAEEWDIVVRYDLIDRTYEVARVTREVIVPLGSYARFIDARRATELSFTPPLNMSGAKGRKGYVGVQVDVQTVEMSDLDEVQRWLRGEARPVVQLRRSPGTAVSRGLRTLVSRLLGGEVRHLEARTPTTQF